MIDNAREGSALDTLSPEISKGSMNGTDVVVLDEQAGHLLPRYQSAFISKSLFLFIVSEMVKPVNSK